MNINRDSCDDERQDEKFELDESVELEIRLKKLLTYEKRKLKRPRNVFNNIQEDVPKLRRSVVTRALQPYISSTPMPTKINGGFFCTDNSLNISPINGTSENFETKLHGDKEQNNEKQNEEKESLKIDRNVSLVKSQIHITISDSSSDTETEESSKNIENNKQHRKSRYNTRSLDKNKSIKQLMQEEGNSRNKIEGKKTGLSCDYFLRKDNVQNQKQESNKNLNDTKDILTPNVRTSTRLNQRDNLSDRKRIDVCILKKSNLSSNNSELDPKKCKSVNITSKCTRQSRRGLREDNELLKQIDSQGFSPTRNNGKRISEHMNSKSPNHNLNDLLPNNTDLKHNKSTHHEFHLDVPKRNIRNSPKANKSVKEMSKNDNSLLTIDEINKNPFLLKNYTDSLELVRGTTKNCEQNLQENSHCSTNEVPQKMSPRNITQKNNVANNTTEVQNILSLLQNDEDIEQRNGHNSIDIKTKLNKKSNVEIKNPLKNPSKIPLLRSRSKSNDKFIEQNTKTLRSRSREFLVHNNKSPEALDERNNCNNLTDKLEETKNVHTSSELPPKPPPRKKKHQKERHILKQISDANKNSSLLHRLQTSPQKNSMKTSPHRLTQNHKQINVLKNICVSEPKKVAKTLVDSGMCDVESIQKDPRVIKVYNIEGISPIISENEMKTICVSNNTEKMLKSYNKVLADHENSPNLEMTLVEEITAPIKFADKYRDFPKRSAMPEKTLVDVGLSPLNFGNVVPINRNTSEDRIRTQNLNKLLQKLSKKKDSPNTPTNPANSESHFTKVDHTLHKEVQTSPKAPHGYTTSPKSTCRETHISLKSPGERSPRKNVTRNVLTQVFEQQTQTTSSLTKMRKNMRMGKESRNGNKSDTSDQSEILRDLDKDTEYDVLFQSLVEEEFLRFTPPVDDDDDSSEDTLHSNISHSLPWRLDDNLFPPRNSSFKLNFIRSAHDIETDRQSSKLHNTLHPSELELEKLGVKKSDTDNNTNERSRKTKLHRYSRANLQNNEKKINSPKCTDNEERLASHSPMSDLLLTGSISKSNQDCQEERELSMKMKVIRSISSTKDSPSQLQNSNIKENNWVDAQPIEEYSDEEVISFGRCNEDDSQSRAKSTEINFKQSLIVVINNDRDLILSKTVQSNTKEENIKGTNKTTKTCLSNMTFKSKKKNNNDKQQNIYVSEDDNEILATPLEDSEIPHSGDGNDKQDSTQNLQSTDILSPKTFDSEVQQCDEPNFKVPKTKVSKVKKKAVPANDAHVFSMTDTIVSGIRRSGRERKPPQRRLCGVIETTSERETVYYDASSLLHLKDVSSFRTNTKKKNKIKKKEPAINKGKSTKKGTRQTKDDEQLDIPVVNEVVNNFIHCNKQVSSYDEINTDKREKHHTTADSNSTTDKTSIKESYITPKKARISNKERDYSSIIDSIKKRSLLKNKTYKKDVARSIFPPENQNSTNVDIDDKQVPDSHITNDNDDNAHITDGHISHINHFGTELPIERNDYNSKLDQHNGSIEKDTQAYTFLDENSCRSASLNSCEDDNLRTSRPLSGRIRKKYKKRENISNKISRVMSRTINNSRDVEISNVNEPNVVDSSSRVQTPLPFTEPTENEYINILCNDNIVSMKCVEDKPHFRQINDLKVSNVLKNSKDGGGMGYLKLPPGTEKPLHIARKYALFYFVIEGEAVINIHNKTFWMRQLGNFIVPLGTEYSITNKNKEKSLILGFVKVIPTNVASQ